MKKIMNIQKRTKFMIFLHEKETFLQKNLQRPFLFQILCNTAVFLVTSISRNFRQVVRHIGSTILNFANLTMDL